MDNPDTGAVTVQSVAVKVVGIVSGGQTGPDRAALDVAIELGIPYTGWVPADGWAEDLVDPPGLLALYPALRTTEQRSPAARTELNVRDATATLVIRRPGVVSLGAELTIEFAQRLARPLLVVDGTPDDVPVLEDWLRDLGDEVVLNVAGPRESEQPGGYDAARLLLRSVLVSRD